MQPTQTTVTGQMVTPARTLRAAALYLSRHGWVQGSYYDQTATVFTPAACLVGALAMVCYGGPVEAPAQHFDEPGWAEFEAAAAYLDRYLAGRTDAACAYEFNDAPGRTIEQVRELQESAADTWDLLHVKCPECREPAYSRPPTDWHMPQWCPVPTYSHRDGSPLCPVHGSDGVTPSVAVMAGPGTAALEEYCSCEEYDCDGSCCGGRCSCVDLVKGRAA